MRKKAMGLTYGDPASIGPEILQETLKRWRFNLKPIVIGAKHVIFKDPIIKKNDIAFYEVDSLTNYFVHGKPTKSSGLHSYFCLKEVVSLATKNKIVAVVTGPVSKLAIDKAGIPFKGQTEEIAKLCGLSEEKVIMLFVA